MKKFVYILIIGLSINIYAANMLLKNKDIIDIGDNKQSSEIEVPKERIVTEPSMTISGNRITYQERVQSEKFDCETDFLGVETCEKERNVCPSNEEYTDGYSSLHHVSKSFSKICNSNQIKFDDKCYFDENQDGFKDNKLVVNTTYTSQGKLGPFFPIDHYFSAFGHFNVTGVNFNDKFYILSAGNYIIYVTADFFSTIKIDGTSLTTSTGAAKFLGPFQIYRISKYFSVGEHSIAIFSVNGGGILGTAVSIKYGDGTILWDTSAGQTISYTDCPSGYTIDGDYCYVNAACPSGTSEQLDGSCLMEYDWYSYHCPTDSNDYSNPWTVVDGGSDCGHFSCTNSATPPQNNCVRLDYTCPIDPNMKCGKTKNDVGICEDGYIWNSERCERLATFCGESTYNAVMDVCQDITTYDKNCSNEGEVYNIATNKCETNTRACPHGVYSEQYNSCIMDFVPNCQEDGYVFNYQSGICENPDAPLCRTQYNYDNSSGLCKGEMVVCLVGETYNPSTNKCEKTICDSDTNDTGIRCEKDIVCDGIINKNNKCVPYVIVE